MRTQDEKHIKNFLTRVTVATYSANIIGKRSELEKGIMQHIKELGLIDEIETMSRFIKNWFRDNNKSVIATIFRLIVNNQHHRMPIDQARSYLKNLKKAPTFFNTMVQPNHKSRWELVFKKDGEYLTLTPEAVAFIASL